MGANTAGSTTELFGVRLHDLPSEEHLRAACAAFLAGDGLSRVYTPNPEIMLRARDDRGYAQVLNSADLALPDGAGLALVLSLRARRRVRRWPGVDVAATLLRLVAARGERAVFVGGAAGVTERAAEGWRSRVPSLRVEVVGAGTPIDAHGRAPRVEDDAELVDRIHAIRPALVLVGLGAPKQERWIDLHASDLPGVRVAMGVGGAFDMWAGSLRRAPRTVRRFGLEWAWRLALEPHRLPRILRATVVFPYRALVDRVA